MSTSRSAKIQKLYLAVKRDNHSDVRLILQHHPNLVDKRHKKDRKSREAPLHLAARLGLKEMVQLLLAEGANPRLRDTDRRTPLHVALISGKEDVSQVLCDIDSKNDLKGPSSRTPLHLAAQRGYAGIARKLLAAGAKTCAQCSNCRTPLHYALVFGGEEVSEVLVELDSGNDLVDFFGNTPFDLAVQKGYAGVVRKLLLSNVQNKIGVYPLWFAMNCLQHNITPMILSMCAWRDIEIDWKNHYLGNQIHYCINILSECQAEIQKMKDTKLHGTTVSYYHLARISGRKLALYLENDEMRNELCRDRSLDYPNYTVLIDLNVRDAKKWKALTSQCLECFAILSRNLPSLSRIGIDSVLLYLSENEMRSFVEVFTF